MMPRYLSLCLCYFALASGRGLLLGANADTTTQPDQVVRQAAAEAESRVKDAGFLDEVRKNAQDAPTSVNLLRAAVVLSVSARHADHELIRGAPTVAHANELNRRVSQDADDSLRFCEAAIMAMPGALPALSPYYAQVLFVGRGSFADAAAMDYLALISGNSLPGTASGLAADYGSMYSNFVEGARDASVFLAQSGKCTPQDRARWLKMRTILKKPGGVEAVLLSEDRDIIESLQVLHRHLTGIQERYAARVTERRSMEEMRLAAMKKNEAEDTARAKDYESVRDRMQELESAPNAADKIGRALTEVRRFAGREFTVTDRMPNDAKIVDTCGQWEADVLNAYYRYIVQGDRKGGRLLAEDMLKSKSDVRLMRLILSDLLQSREWAEAKTMCNKIIAADPEDRTAQHMAIEIAAMMKKAASSSATQPGE